MMEENRKPSVSMDQTGVISCHNSDCANACLLNTTNFIPVLMYFFRYYFAII